MCHFQAWPIKASYLQTSGLFSILAGLDGDDSQGNLGHPLLKIVEPQDGITAWRKAALLGMPAFYSYVGEK